MVARGLSRRFGAKLAVDSLDLTVKRGEVLALLGHNGAGKTTTVRLLNGVLAPSAGEAFLFGLSPFEHGPAVRARVGVLTESQSLEERLDARQNLRYYADLYGYPEDRVAKRIEGLLDEFGLAQVADRPVGGFSKGMKQRLALARALQHEPELLFLDEPTAGLDPVAARQVNEMIRSQSRDAGRTVLLCTHNLIEAQRVCDRVAVMREGRIVALGTPAELTARAAGRSQVHLEVAPSAAVTALAIAERILAENRGSDTLTSAPADGSVSEVPEAAPAVTADASGQLHLSGMARAAIPRLVTALVAAEIPVYRVEPLEPTLQDVYFALYGEASAEEEAGT